MPTRPATMLLRSETAASLSDLSRFGILFEHVPASVGRARVVLLIVGGVALSICFLAPLPPWFDRPLGTLAAIIVVVMGLVCRSRESAERAEASRCIALADAERDRRIRVFSDAAGGLKESQRLLDDTRHVLELQQRLALTDAELSMFPLEQMRGVVDMLGFEQQCGGRLTAIPGHDQVVTPDSCYFLAPAVYDKRGDADPVGTLYLTDARALFLAADGLTIAEWRRVVSVERDGKVLRIQRRDRQTPYLFVMTWGDAMKAEFVAKNAMATKTSIA